MNADLLQFCHVCVIKYKNLRYRYLINQSRNWWVKIKTFLVQSLETTVPVPTMTRVGSCVRCGSVRGNWGEADENGRLQPDQSHRQGRLRGGPAGQAQVHQQGNESVG